MIGKNTKPELFRLLRWVQAAEEFWWYCWKFGDSEVVEIHGIASIYQGVK